MRLHVVPGIGAFCLLAACTHIDEGSVDYRIADAPPEMNAAGLSEYAKDKCSGVSKSTSRKSQFISGKDPVLTRCDPLLPSPLLRKYLTDQSGSVRSFKAGDFYSIDIQQGVMGTRLLENDLFVHEFGSNGQFAVLANVFEFGARDEKADELEKKRFIELNGSTAVPASSGLKLIYYSGDVRRRQPFNFSNIPVVPQTKWGGRSIAIQLIVIEIDSISTPVREMLTTLADFGQNAVPFGGGAKEILLGLGKSLLAGTNHDDRLFEYRMVLSPDSASGGDAEAVFAPGQYVIRRSQIRDNEMAWGNVVLDQNTGRLFAKNQPVRDDLYFTVRIKRFGEGHEEGYAFQDSDAFRQTLSEAADTRDKSLEAILPQVQGLVVSQRAQSWRSSVAASWSNVEKLADKYAANLDPAPRQEFRSTDPNYTCRFYSADDLKKNEQILERSARTSLDEFLTQYKLAAKATYGGNEKAGIAPFKEFPDRDRLAVVGRIADWLAPLSEEDKMVFSTVSNFEKAFATDADFEKLWARVNARVAKKRRDPKDCEEMVFRGFGHREPVQPETTSVPR